jgi:uncharacterized protein
MKTVLITGGTGLVGKALGLALLEKGYQVIILSRASDRASTISNLTYATWNVEQQTIDADAVAKADYIIHLAGAGVADKRWTPKRKQEIVDSRTQSSLLIVDSLQKIENKVKAVISASAIGWYGADPVIPNLKPFIETDPADTAFLGETCKLWEQSIEPVTQSGKRLVILRIGIVLSKDGGALKEFLKPLKLGVAAILGNGKQVISWIHIDDLVRLFMAAIENEKMNGTYNAVAPIPVTNKELTLTLAKSKKNFFIPFHVPAFLLKLVLGEMSIEVLKSATVSAIKTETTGFAFKYPLITAALQ